MVPWPQLLAFTATALVIIVIPGPAVLFIVGRSLALGRRGGLLSVVGTTLGLIVLVIAVSLGLGVLVTESEVAYLVIKYAGAAYLVWLGISAIRHRKKSAAEATGDAPATSLRRILGEGFVVGVTNPKTLAFFVAVLPPFVDRTAGNTTLQLLELGLIFIVFGWLSDSIWAWAAGSARDWFASSPHRVEHLATIGGVVMIVLGIVLAFVGGH